MDIDIRHVPPYDPPTEFVERKGAGHPDTICDALAEGLARDLSAHYRERHGTLKHFNVDKALLAAGQVRIAFGGGEVVQPSRIILAGKVDARESFPPLGDLTRKAYERLGEILPWAVIPGDYAIELRLNPSSNDLMPLLERGAEARSGAPLANDTSFAVVSLPRSPLEAAVHAVERELAYPATRAELPIGADIKVMAMRRGDDVRVTVAAALLAREVPNAHAYRSAKGRVREIACRVVAKVFRDRGRPLGALEVNVNRADLEPDGAYLTLTGSSAEAGDDGQVGRGNRVGGLITPHRSMSLEAACGKHPAGHVGKVYHAFAHDIAAGLLERDGIEGATVRLLSEIGRPVDEPVAVELELVGSAGEGFEIRAREVVERVLADWEAASRGLEEGRYELC